MTWLFANAANPATAYSPPKLANVAGMACPKCYRPVDNTHRGSDCPDALAFDAEAATMAAEIAAILGLTGRFKSVHETPKGLVG